MGLVICRGALINSFAIDGMEEIENPYWFIILMSG